MSSIVSVCSHVTSTHFGTGPSQIRWIPGPVQTFSFDDPSPSTTLGHPTHMGTPNRPPHLHGDVLKRVHLEPSPLDLFQFVHHVTHASC